MRIRNVLAAVLLAGLTATPATAGEGGPDGGSEVCTDGFANEIAVGVDSPVTVAVQLYPAGGVPTSVYVCFSPTAANTPGFLVGGAVGIDIDPDGGATPGAQVRLLCLPDNNGEIWPQCDQTTSAYTAPGDVDVDPVSDAFCLVSVDGSCRAYVPGLRVRTNAGTTPLLSLTLFGGTQNVNAPAQCIEVFTTSPCE